MGAPCQGRDAEQRLEHLHTVRKATKRVRYVIKVLKAAGFRPAKPVRKIGKAAKAGKYDSLFGLLAGVVPLGNNSCLTAIIAMMPDFNAHGLESTWAKPKVELV